MKKNKGEEESEAVKCVYNHAQNQNNWSEWFEVIRQADLSTSVQHMQDRETDCQCLHLQDTVVSLHFCKMASFELTCTFYCLSIQFRNGYFWSSCWVCDRHLAAIEQ